MWSAIKSDLLDFVSTIQADTTKTLTKVLGDEDEEEEESLQDKLHADLRRSYETYANPLRENKQREYDRFKKRFTLTKYATEIAEVLDAEGEVSRFYAELVPLSITAEEFWARYFFRLHLLTRHGKANFEEDDEEEELVWESTEDLPSLPSGSAPPAPASLSPVSPASQSHPFLLTPSVSHDLLAKDQRIAELEEENGRLRARIRELEEAQRNNKREDSSPPPLRSPPSPFSSSLSTPPLSEHSSGVIVKEEDVGSIEGKKDERETEEKERGKEKEREKYLASLDEEDEEDGWN